MKYKFPVKKELTEGKASTSNVMRTYHHEQAFKVQICLLPVITRVSQCFIRVDLNQEKLNYKDYKLLLNSAYSPVF